MKISKTTLLILLTMMFRESLERLSQQERCIAGLEAQLAEAKLVIALKDEDAAADIGAIDQRPRCGELLGRGRET